MSLPSEQNWLVLQHLIIDLTKKGYEIPSGINPEMGLRIYLSQSDFSSM